ncbi:ATP-binding protein [Moraxella sp. DOX410]|nr:ATP-binding protein [Moraxella sp. DOX410]WNP27005.1 ATP-binding protein [Moraxella sp. DOX410]
MLLQRTIESERIEYKADWNPESVMHTLCAFANDFHNLGSGYIVIGVVEDNGRPMLPPVGLSLERIDKILKELVQLEKNTIMPTYNTLTATYDIEGKTILVIWAIAEEIRPYETKVYQSKEFIHFNTIFK